MIIGIDANEANVKNRVGSNQFAYQILKQLNRLDSRNTYIIFLKNPPLKDLPPVNQQWQYKVIKPGFLWTQWRLPLSLYLNYRQLDIFLTLGHYAPRFSPVKTMVCLMDLAYLKFPQQFLKQDLKKLTAWTQYSVKKASHIFTISDSSKKDIQNYYHTPGQKITVVYPAVNLPINSLTSPVKGDYLLYLGTLQPRKNLDNLVLAFGQISSIHPHLKLVLSGKKGWMYQSLFSLVKKMRLSEKVIFTGFVSDSQLIDLVKKAKLLILPSFYEGFGIPVVLAMKLKTSVLVSRNSSLQEIVGKTGNYIEPPFGNKEIKKGIIKALSLDQATKKIQIQSAQKRADQFSWANSAQKIMEVLNEVVKNN